MNRLVDKLSQSIATSQNLGDQERQVIAYGMLATAQMLIIFVLSALVGVLANCLIPCLIVYFAVGLFRKYTGGAHGSSMTQCIIVSVSSIGVMGWASKVLPQLLSPASCAVIYVLCVAFALIVVYKKAPVDSPNKPITNPKKIARLRRGSFCFVGAVTGCCILFCALSAFYENPCFLSYALALCLSLVWQSVNLTPLLVRI